MASGRFCIGIDTACKLLYNSDYFYYGHDISLFGGYPIKFLASILGAGILCFALFILTAKAFPDSMKNSRIDTWSNRIENFASGESEDNYQAEKAKIAIASGEIYGKGPGKSVQKNFLPQSSSDFIYAIIGEEFGLIGAILIIIFFLGLLFRIVIIATKSITIFGTLLCLGVGLPIIFQAMINMGVAVGLFPGNRTAITTDQYGRYFDLDDLFCYWHSLKCQCFR